MKERLKKATFYELFLLFLFTFVMYMCIDITSKKYIHSKYDMKGILSEIQKHYPNSTLTYQNINIIGGKLKEKPARYGTITFFDSVGVRIKNGKLVSEFSFGWMFFIILPILSFIFIVGDPRETTLEDFYNLDINTKGKFTLSIPLFIILLTFFYLNSKKNTRHYYSRQQDDGYFEFKAKNIIKDINVANYEKK